MTPETLSKAQVDQFWRDGYLLAEGGVGENQLELLKRQLSEWGEESRAHSAPFGPETVDGRARFDMGEEHSPETPALRRVNNPSEISDVYRDAMTAAPVVTMVADLIGPDVKYHHCKINQKMPDSQTRVFYHQDFPFTPHSNDDIVTALILLDDMDEENGCLTVAPGTHRGPIHSLFKDGEFLGRVGDDIEADMQSRQLSVTGKAGSVCLMHTRLMHGSQPNRSPDRNRGLYICVYTAADAIPLARNPMPSPNEGLIVKGKPSPTARMIDLAVELPKQPKSASFFTVQGQKSADDEQAS